MSDPYHNPEDFGLKQVFFADAGESYEYDMLVIWERPLVEVVRPRLDGRSVNISACSALFQRHRHRGTGR